ncbi:MAG: hypothetical protein JNM17_06590 [Archangium sp.]|nr:hypothetical protein [Archangium sp.]
MMRQVALGAVVAFALTVLALSVFTPSAEPTPPVVTTNPTPAPNPGAATPGMRMAVPVRPMILKPSNAIRPEMLQPRQLQAIEAPAIDAGVP